MFTGVVGTRRRQSESMIKSIFYSRFHPGKGPQVVHQVPSGSQSHNTALTPPTTTTSTSPPPTSPPLFDFETVSEYIIPKQELCDRLVTVCTNKYRILGYPVCLEDRKYERNEFIFNFAIVLDEDVVEYSTYKSVVRKVAKLFKALEEQSGFLSNEVTAVGVFALIEQVLEDLNNYSECMIPINESNTINIKLFPTYAPPPQVKAFHVPVCTVQLENLMDVNWDLTMQRIVPFIDGINSVRRISELADADYSLTRKCIEHLLYYGCLIMVDVFQFSAIYACTAEISTLVQDPSLQEECQAYVSYSSPRIPFPFLLQLYTSLTQGLTLKKWCMENATKLKGIDVRRFVSFGIVKGFLYRSHKYPVPAEGKVDRALPLARYLDGGHHFDEICTDLQVSEKDVMGMLEGRDVQIVHR
ncbi:nitrogen permease regulator 2 [Tuber borchii]|uniref:Nitrogen permease regulator 2 n=1 Tax=Tuber borchii TaxID=42251 RepID=A0A2T7A605_TUBBO|nr:nitrogen permease regulator 2 [Tuber borchii]